MENDADETACDQPGVPHPPPPSRSCLGDSHLADSSLAGGWGPYAPLRIASLMLSWRFCTNSGDSPTRVPVAGLSEQPPANPAASIPRARADNGRSKTE